MGTASVDTLGAELEELARDGFVVLPGVLHPPFMGHVDGMHPARLIDPNYRDRDRAEARRASELLERRR